MKNFAQLLIPVGNFFAWIRFYKHNFIFKAEVGCLANFVLSSVNQSRLHWSMCNHPMNLNDMYPT